jgi:hypothetical protein
MPGSIIGKTLYVPNSHQFQPQILWDILRTAMKILIFKPISYFFGVYMA